MWNVITTERFDAWFNKQTESLQDEFLAILFVHFLLLIQPARPLCYAQAIKQEKIRSGFIKV